MPIRLVRVLPYGLVVGGTAVGPTAGGALVEIYGGGFRLPSKNPPQPDGPVQKTVSVRFGAVEAPYVGVSRSNLLQVVTPPSPLPFDDTPMGESGIPRGNQGFVDVSVSNLDDSGNEIPGESATLPQSYAYVMPRLTSVNDSILSRVVAQVVENWRRDVMPNTLTSQSVEWDAGTGDLLSRVDVARLPAIVLLGPRTSEGRFHHKPGDRAVRPEVVPGSPQQAKFLVAKMPFTLDLTFDVVGMARERIVLLNMMSVATNYVHRTPYVDVLRDPVRPDLGSIRFEFAFGEAGAAFDVDAVPNESDLHSFRGSVIVRGVDVENVEIPGDGGIGAVPRIEQILIDYSRFRY